MTPEKRNLKERLLDGLAWSILIVVIVLGVGGVCHVFSRIPTHLQYLISLYQSDPAYRAGVNTMALTAISFICIVTAFSLLSWAISRLTK